MGNKITRRRPVIDERYTRPQGLYPCGDVDHRRLRRLILESKLAPCYPGAEEPATELEECPICFLQYPSLNRSKCCTKGVCTECFLQMKAPNASRPTQCPFCKTPGYAVEYRGAKTLEEKGMEQAEEQKVIEAKIRMRQQELHDDEERERRREEDIRLGRITVETPYNNHPASITPIDDTEGRNWRPGWGNADRQEQVCVATPERITSEIDPYPLWADGDYESHREDEFDLDLEDIMVMEAIWLSIQEQGAPHRFADVEANRPSELVTEISLDSEPGVDLAAGGLAVAIAALAERQAVGGITAPASQSTIVDHRAGEDTGNEPGRQLHDDSPEELSQRAEENSLTEIVASTSGREEEDEDEAEIARSEKLAHRVNSKQQEEYRGSKSLGEIGTSVATSAPSSSSSSELTWETPRNGDDEKVLLPDSFEERMMLAMALSIADAQASMVHQGDTSLPQLTQ